jgi:hypothetical protein
MEQRFTPGARERLRLGAAAQCFARIAGRIGGAVALSSCLHGWMPALKNCRKFNSLRHSMALLRGA